MSKSDDATKSYKHQSNQILTHPKEVLDLLDPEGQTCQFEPIALDLARHGLHVHPLRPGDKRPVLKGYQSIATTDPDCIAKWAAEHPSANVGSKGVDVQTILPGTRKPLVFLTVRQLTPML